ncbi:hypothetical protein V2J09_011928 [Rumex salicifolius]
MVNSPESWKFLCSYGGRIIPRPSDGLLRYIGGHTRVVSVPRTVSYSELIAKLSEICGYSAAVRCQLPGEEMDVLVSITSDEDLANIIDEYDRSSSVSGKELKIRAVLSPPNPPSQTRSTSSSPSSSNSCDEDVDYHRPVSPTSPIGYLSETISRSSIVQPPHRADWNQHRLLSLRIFRPDKMCGYSESVIPGKKLRWRMAPVIAAISPTADRIFIRININHKHSREADPRKFIGFQSSVL